MSARAELVDFSRPLLTLELGYLVAADSPIRTTEDIDKAGMRIGVTQGSTSERTLPEASEKRVLLRARA